MLAKLQQLYSGFYLDAPVGNNAFSWNLRQHKSLYVPTLIEGRLDDLAVGENITFCEVVDGREQAHLGLRRFIYFQKGGKHFFIFDNHNHAFCFWVFGVLKRLFPKGLRLVHVDQHSDMREPETWFSDAFDLNQAFDYTNNVLNVGNFIKPALKAGVFSDVDVIDGEYALNKHSYNEKIVLDVDVDFFAPEMAFIDHDLKIKKIREYLQMADFVTIATSPFFIDQTLAINVIKELLA